MDHKTKIEIQYYLCNTEEKYLNNFSIFKYQRPEITLDDYKYYLSTKNKLELVQIAAICNEQTIGILSIEKHPHFPFDRDYLYLSGVYVLPEFRNYGIGSQLIQKAQEYTDLKNLPVYLSTTTANNNINQFYLKQGFTTGGEWLYFKPNP